jgi:hypothetical protein
VANLGTHVGTVRHRVIQQPHAAALPGGADGAEDRGLEALVRVGDDQLEAAQTAPDQALQEPGPEGLASLGPMCRPVPGLDPGISRLPSVLAATAIIIATETMRPPSRCLR